MNIEAKIAAHHMQRWVISTFVRYNVDLNSGAILTVYNRTGDSMIMSRSWTRPATVIITLSFHQQTPIRLVLDCSNDTLWQLKEYVPSEELKPAGTTPHQLENWLYELACTLLEKGFGSPQTITTFYPSQFRLIRWIQSLFFRTI